MIKVVISQRLEGKTYNDDVEIQFKDENKGMEFALDALRNTNEDTKVIITRIPNVKKEDK